MNDFASIWDPHTIVEINVDRVVSMYPERPYQYILGYFGCRQELIDFVMENLMTFYVSDLMPSSKSPSTYSCPSQVNLEHLETLIQQGILFFLQRHPELAIEGSSHWVGEDVISTQNSPKLLSSYT